MPAPQSATTPVTFVLGRAGTGKTHHCIQQMVAAMRHAAMGPPLLLIVPPQATFNAERALLSDPALGPLRGSFRANALSFRRLAILLAEELHIDRTQELDDLARIIQLERVVRDHQSRLTLFAPVANRPGFVQRLDATIRELTQFGHTPDTLTAIAAKLQQQHTAGSPQDRVLIGKLQDLALLLHEWNTVLGPHRDGETLLPDVTAKLAQSTWLTGARLWIDGFSAFTRLELNFIAALANHAASVTITLTLDPTTPAARGTADTDRFSLFHRPEHTLQQLRLLLRDASIPIHPPIALSHHHRAANCPPLARIEQHLFATPPAIDPEEPAPTCIELWESANPESEVRAAAQKIRELISADPTLRYRDIGLIIPDLDSYADAIRRLFSAARIPHFIDQRRAIGHHPLVELLLAATHYAGTTSAEDLVILLKTGLTSIAETDTHQLENYLLTHGITHTDLAKPFTFIAPNKEDEDDTLRPDQRAAISRINITRLRLRTALEPWLKLTSPSTTYTTGATLARGLFVLLQSIGAEKQMAALIDRSTASPEQLLIHQQAWNEVIALFERLDQLLTDRPLPLEEFTHLLEVAADSLTLGLIPPTLDQVLISSVTRSRHPELRTVIILGALERQFPQLKTEDPLLNDQQRALFNQASTTTHNLPIPAGTEQDLLDSQYFDYQAFTRAQERLIISYPIADARGKALVRSQYIPRLRTLFPQLPTQHFDYLRSQNLSTIITADDLLSVIFTTTAQHTPSQNTQPLDPDLAAAYHWVITTSDSAIATRRDHLWPALSAGQPPTLSEPLAQRCYPGTLRMSVSQLEKFAACPLQYFLHYTLGLKQRETLQVDVMQMGTLFHRILENVYEKIIRQDIPWPNCDEQALRAVVDQAVDQAAAELHPELAEITPAYAKLRQRAKRTLGIVVEAQRRAALAGDIRPLATELVFGSKPANDRTLALPVLSIATPAGRTVQLNGKIDRLDISRTGNAAIVIDYKSAAGKQLKLSSIYHGLALQLPVYLLVLRDNADKLVPGRTLYPAGSLFVPLSRKRETDTAMKETLHPNSAKFYQGSTPRGLIDINAASSLDRTNADKTDWYEIALTKEGIPSQRGDAISHEDFQLILDFARHKIAALADALARGHIAPHPYKESNQIPCDWCDFRSACTFDQTTGLFRGIISMKREEALAHMRRELENPS